jgi:hypothetical protein
VDAITGEDRGSPFLAGGRLHTDEASLANDDVVPGMLGNVTAIAELTSDRAAALLGSTDGYLYAIDPCASPLALIWSVSVGAPVGEAVFADTDGDGFDEILFTAGDGYLYGVDTQAFPPPQWVYDTDSGISDEDVDDTYGESLSAAWGGVPGAAGYEWAVFVVDGRAISQSPTDPESAFVWTDGETAELHSGLTYGTRYFFVVRAVGPRGEVSPEVLSDGTRYSHDASDSGPTDGGPDASGDGDPSVEPSGGCSCRAVGQ